MTTTIISSAVNHGIILHSGNYTSELTITGSGAVDGPAYGVNGLGVYLDNAGNIRGGTIGTDISGTLNNSGFIYGQNVGAAGVYAVMNNSGGISASTIGVDLVSSSLYNQGLINANSGIGVFVNNSWLNNNGSVAGNAAGVLITGGGVYNTGTISGSKIGLYGGSSTLNNAQNLHITNEAGGVITGNLFGAGILNSNGTAASLVNDGVINGVEGGVVVKNTSFDNEGAVGGFTIGVALYGGTAVNNGTIRGGQIGVYAQQGSLLNGGYISGGTFAIKAQTSLALTLAPGSHLHGLVVDYSGDGLLELTGTGGKAGGTGENIIGFSTIDFAPGAAWTLEGNTGDFSFSTNISGFAAGDTIVVDSFDATNSQFVSGTGLVLNNGTTAETLALTGNFTGEQFIATTQGANTAITLESSVACFCPGTRIHTVRGKTPVESLKIGDLVQTATQGFQPIRWIGHRAYNGRFIAGNHLALPVTLRRHALGRNIPSRDLTISPGHAVCEAGVLIHAWRLVNGTSITQAEQVERVEYYHIELDSHAVIFAENTPVESFLDNGCRAQFLNATGMPGTAQKPCLPLIEEGYHLARLKARIDARAGLNTPRQPGMLRGNFDHAGAHLLCGWAQDEAAPELPVELEVLCDGRPVARFIANKFRADLRAAGLGSGCHAFELPAPPLPGQLTLRRVSDGAVLGTARQQAA